MSLALDLIRYVISDFYPVMIACLRKNLRAQPCMSRPLSPGNTLPTDDSIGDLECVA